MGSWQYVYFFPGPHSRWLPLETIESLLKDGFQVENRSGDFTKRLADRLLSGRQTSTTLQKDFADSNTILTINGEFAITSSNPHICLSWPRRLFDALSPTTQAYHWSCLRRAAKASGTVNLQIGADLLIDGECQLDVSNPGLEWIWIDEAAGGRCPAKVDSSTAHAFGDGFVQYSVNRV